VVAVQYTFTHKQYTERQIQTIRRTTQKSYDILHRLFRKVDQFPSSDQNSISLFILVSLAVITQVLSQTLQA
jgi:hypothetical protein